MAANWKWNFHPQPISKKYGSNYSQWYPPQISQQSWTSKMKHFGDMGSQWYKMADFLIGDNIVKYAN